MYQVTIFCVAVIISFKACIAQVLQFGVCSEAETMKFFQLEKFLGKWYEIERFPTWYEENGNCAYKFINQCGRRIEIEHGFVRNGIEYVLHINSSYTPGDEAVFEIKKSNIDPVGVPLTVITTDYNNYAIVYGCKNSTLLGIQIKYTWILSRSPKLPEEILEKAYNELNAVPYAYVAYLEPVLQSEASCRHQWTAHVNAEENEVEHDEKYFKDD